VVPVKWTKKETSKETWNNSNTWGYGWDYDTDADYSDPFYWQGDSGKPTYTTGEATKLWSVIDLANDYVKQNATDLNRLHNLRDELMDFICDLDAILEVSDFACS
jgi:hypothetical protein